MFMRPSTKKGPSNHWKMASTCIALDTADHSPLYQSLESHTQPVHSRDQNFIVTGRIPRRYIIRR